MTRAAKLSRAVATAVAIIAGWAWMTAAADHDLNARYVETHPCLERRRTLPNYRQYMGVPVWKEAATGYECPNVDGLIWIDDPQPERFEQ